MAIVHVICGPPCAGKSTYLEEHRQAADVVVDWDEIVTDLGYQPRQHLVDASLLPIISDEWRRRLAAALQHDGTVWVVRAKPRREAQPLAMSLHADLIEVTAPLEVLLERAASRPYPEAHRRLILDWHNRYAWRRR